MENKQPYIWNENMLAELHQVAEAIERIRQNAAAMELGASGFDNMQSVKIYSAIQGHLQTAHQSLEAAQNELKVQLRK